MGKDEFTVYLENMIKQWDGTAYGRDLYNMATNGTSLETIADYLDVELEEE